MSFFQSEQSDYQQFSFDEIYDIPDQEEIFVSQLQKKIKKSKRHPRKPKRKQSKKMQKETQGGDIVGLAHQFSQMNIQEQNTYKRKHSMKMQQETQVGNIVGLAHQFSQMNIQEQNPQSYLPLVLYDGQDPNPQNKGGDNSLGQ